ncbi:chemotaxis protein CheB [Microcoleus sp. FACHB-672]|uniref:chemotaxis protein CheB n=1 Tax=Microcoleus sp. FACHB-672 TaxID=2692825 RepID=UPI001681D41C|nr:chemotaxis protein CheB [Microcoleus sp. FACHB-672]MBD2041943.1 chemotaxis protein CheB [Microcoleus sp. FACHB-672]
MPGHDIIVIGASAGGVDALSKLVRKLPSQLPAAIFIVLHMSANSRSLMADILNRAGALKAMPAKDGDVIEHGHIYIAPPNHHLLIKPGYIRLSQGPKENCHRPAVDPLFRTAARAYGQRVVGVILSGTLDDGTAGLIAVKSCGGVAIVQNPEEAMFSGMPKSAINNVSVDHVLPITEIAAQLVQLADQLVHDEDPGPMPEEIKLESDIAELDRAAMEREAHRGTPANLGCPTCGGTLWEHNAGDLLRFRCRVGHAWSADSLISQQSEAIEEALWTAFRALEESSALSRRLAKRAHGRKQGQIAARFEDEALEREEQAEVIRKVLANKDKHDYLEYGNN